MPSLGQPADEHRNFVGVPGGGATPDHSPTSSRPKRPLVILAAGVLPRGRASTKFRPSPAAHPSIYWCSSMATSWAGEACWSTACDSAMGWSTKCWIGCGTRF